MKRRLVVVGGALGGHRAAVHAHRIDPELEITVIGAEDELPYQRPPLSKGFLQGKVSEERVRLRGAGDHYRLLTATPATGLDLERSNVLTDRGPLPYDLLIIATGAEPRQLAGFERSERFIYLRRLADARRLRDLLPKTQHLTVIGGGFIGAEVAVSARALGIEVTLVEQADHLLSRAVGGGVSRHVEDNLRTSGVVLELSSTVTVVDEGKRTELTNGQRTWATDLVVVGVGVIPATGWLDGALPLLEDRSLAVTEMGLVSGYTNIGAVGDVASWYHPLYGQPLRFEHFEVAALQAVHCAANLVSPDRSPYRDLPFGWSDQGELLIQILGIPGPNLDEQEEEVEDGRLFLYSSKDQLRGAVLLNASEAIMDVKQRLSTALTANESQQ